MTVPAISPDWSPVARFGGFARDDEPGGVRQARAFAAAAAESEDQRAWRNSRGELDPVAHLDPLDGCF